jgi:2-oxo-3-hexenedioate decarboxylase
MRAPFEIDAIASAAFAALGSGRQVAPFSSHIGDFTLDDAYRATDAVRRLREASGERVAGRKIGFTNRTIWAEYGVYAPIWGFVYDRTVRDLADIGDPFFLSSLTEPRIEPEIVFGLAAPPTRDMDDAALLACIDWVAHGFEIVQSIFRGWRFSAADTVAAFGLHGALLIGDRHPVAPRRAEWHRTLSTFEIDLFRNGTQVDHGRAANVLDGPLSALRHLVDLLTRDPVNPPLAAGEIVTTGTLTRAFPIAAGESWRTSLSGVPLDGIVISFA